MFPPGGGKWDTHELTDAVKQSSGGNGAFAALLLSADLPTHGLRELRLRGTRLPSDSEKEPLLLLFAEIL